jgi:uncharacterized protein
MNEFHYAFKVKDIASTRQFYMGILGCGEGRSTETWIDFDFFGHQLSAHISNNRPPLDFCGKVDGISVPMPHFGCILSYEQFVNVQKKLEDNKIAFIVPPTLRYAGQVGEQMIMFITDFSENPIEFKAFKNKDEIFAK